MCICRNLIPNLSVNGTVCLAFYYHMWGYHMGSLIVYTVDFIHGNYLLQWSMSGDQGNIWLEARITIASLTPAYQVCIVLVHCAVDIVKL
jgi:hypothetical protein